MRTVVRRKPRVVDDFVDAALAVVNAFLSNEPNDLHAALKRLEAAAGHCAREGEFIYEQTGDE